MNMEELSRENEAVEQLKARLRQLEEDKNAEVAGMHRKMRW
jgi:hypothetical protein